MLKALIFDVDGTLADTERAHLSAFNQAFAEAGLDWNWSVPAYQRLLEVAGGKERIRAYWASRGDMPRDTAQVDGVIRQLHAAKTRAYEAAVQAGAVPMRPGVLNLLHRAEAAGLRLAIATTTSPENVDALLGHWCGVAWRQRFSVIEDASTAERKKPDPQVYQQALCRLGLPAANCLAFEDSANGLRAARAAGLATVVTPNAFTAHHDFSGAAQVLENLDGVSLLQLHGWLCTPGGASTFVS